MARVVARDDVGCKHPRQRKGNPMSNRAILVVDLQNEYWPSGKFPLHGIAAAAANAARIMAMGVREAAWRSEEHTSELQSLMRISYAVFGLKKKKDKYNTQ